MTALAQPVEKTGTLRHVVALKFKAGTDEAEIKKVENAFRDFAELFRRINSDTDGFGFFEKRQQFLSRAAAQIKNFFGF